MYSWNILKSSDPETLLDLSSLESIDAGFVQNSNDVNRHEITAENEAQINLANLQSVRAPEFIWDWIRFNISDTAGIDLESLATLTTAGRGQTRIQLLTGASLSLPALASLTSVTIAVSGGAELTTSDVGSATFSSAPITTNDGDPWNTRNYPWDILKASDPGTMLNLSSLVEIDAGFSRNSNDNNRHEVTCSAGAEIDLSGVEAVIGPTSSSAAWLRFTAGDGCLIDLSALADMSGYVRLEATGTGRIDMPRFLGLSGDLKIDLGGDSELDVGDLSENLTLSSARLRATLADNAGLVMSEANLRNGSSISLDGAGTRLDVADYIEVSDGSSLTASVAGAYVEIGGDFEFKNALESEVALASATVRFNGDGTITEQRLEVGGYDDGACPPNFPGCPPNTDENFGIGRLIVGELGTPATVELSRRLGQRQPAGWL